MFQQKASSTVSSASAPVEFLCPITRELMQDPVVATTNGHSYERAAIVSFFVTKKQEIPKDFVITNFALRSLIDHYIKQQTLPTQIDPQANSEIPNDFVCSIALEGAMQDPVILADGYTYERSSMTAWFSTGSYQSPRTGARLDNKTMTPNHALKGLIQSFSKTASTLDEETKSSEAVENPLVQQGPLDLRVLKVKPVELLAQQLGTSPLISLPLPEWSEKQLQIGTLGGAIRQNNRALTRSFVLQGEAIFSLKDYKVALQNNRDGFALSS